MVAVHVDCGNEPIVDRVDARTGKFHLNPTLLSAPAHNVRDYDVLTGVDELQRLDSEVIPDGIDLPEEAPVAVVSLVDVGVEDPLRHVGPHRRVEMTDDSFGVAAKGGVI